MWFSLEILFEYEALSKISLQTKIMLAFLLRSKNKNQGKRALTLQQEPFSFIKLTLSARTTVIWIVKKFWKIN